MEAISFIGKGNPMEKINAGYVAFNGYVFTQHDADLYNYECEKVQAFPSDWNKDCCHRMFCMIIGLFK